MTAAITPDHQHRYAQVIRRLDNIINAIESEMRTLGWASPDGVMRPALVTACTEVRRARDYYLVKDYDAIRAEVATP